eukprot:430577_1
MSDNEQSEYKGRFARVHQDPRFRELPTKKRRFTVDKRFARMFSDDKFKLTHQKDKYGRKVNLDKASNDVNLYYQLEDDEKSGDDSKEIGAKSDDNKSESSASESESESESDDKVDRFLGEDGDSPLKKEVVVSAKKEPEELVSSSDDEVSFGSDSSSSGSELDLELDVDEDEIEEIQMGSPTSRLAVVIFSGAICQPRIYSQFCSHSFRRSVRSNR